MVAINKATILSAKFPNPILYVASQSQTMPSSPVRLCEARSFLLRAWAHPLPSYWGWAMLPSLTGLGWGLTMSPSLSMQLCRAPFPWGRVLGPASPCTPPPVQPDSACCASPAPKLGAPAGSSPWMDWSLPIWPTGQNFGPHWPRQVLLVPWKPQIPDFLSISPLTAWSISQQCNSLQTLFYAMIWEVIASFC